MNVFTRVATAILAGMLALALMGAQGCRAPVVTPSPSSSQIAAPGAPTDAPTQIIELPPLAVAVPPDFPHAASPPLPGHRLLTILIQTRDAQRAVNRARVGVRIVGYSDDGSPVLADAQPFYIDEEQSTPCIYDIDVGAGVVLVDVTVALFGWRGEQVLITAEEYGAPTGLSGGGAIDPIMGERGVIIASLPISML